MRKTHVEDRGRIAPPYKGWSICRRRISTKRLVEACSDCAECNRIYARLEESAEQLALEMRPTNWRELFADRWLARG